MYSKYTYANSEAKKQNDKIVEAFEETMDKIEVEVDNHTRRTFLKGVAVGCLVATPIAFLAFKFSNK